MKAALVHQGTSLLRFMRTEAAGSYGVNSSYCDKNCGVRVRERGWGEALQEFYFIVTRREIPKLFCFVDPINATTQSPVVLKRPDGIFVGEFMTGVTTCACYVTRRRCSHTQGSVQNASAT